MHTAGGHFLVFQILVRGLLAVLDEAANVASDEARDFNSLT
jgi:hypothetical protein